MNASDSLPEAPRSPLTNLNEFQSSTRINGHWLLPALASFLIWATFVVMFWLSTISSSDLGPVLELLGTLGLLSSVGTAYLIYAIVDRSNRHYSQTQQLFWNALKTLESKPSDSNAMISFRSAEESTARLASAENQRSAVLWALLSMTPLAGWIFIVAILWLLSRSLAKHSQLEGHVIEDLDRSLRASGLQGITGGVTMILGRNAFGAIVILATLAELVSALIIGYAGCLAVIFITLGSLSLLWLDFSISDPFQHFQNQFRIDTDIVRILPIPISDVGD